MGNRIKTYLVADSVVSALGFTTEENLVALRCGKSGVRLSADGSIADEPIMVARIDDKRLADETRDLRGFSRMERLFVLVVQNLQKKIKIHTSNSDCGLIISTTKGNVSQLSADGNLQSGDFLAKMAQKVADYFGFESRVHVISNACISGVSAFVVAKRLIEMGEYRHVVVAGGDELSHFITSGFRSFKSLSETVCRPYDAAHNGLNLGEACAAVLLSAKPAPDAVWLAGGAISNDANHISGPSRTGEELALAIRQSMAEAGVSPAEISFVNAHGTATVYNDEMESKAVSLAGLSAVPLNSLKPYFGHTLGASGVLETIVCAHELRRGEFFGTLGFSASGVPASVNVSAETRCFPMKACVKTASGFGGCNASVVLVKSDLENNFTENYPADFATETMDSVEIYDGKILRSSKEIFVSDEKDFHAFSRQAYKSFDEQDAKMKFFKMDDLCKLAYLTAHFLLDGVSFRPEKTGIVLANSVSSLRTDLAHNANIRANGDAMAKPADFVYTLPNVAAGEICLRHKIKGENTFFVMDEFHADWLERYAECAMQQTALDFCIVGWCELLGENYKSIFKLIKNKNGKS